VTDAAIFWDFVFARRGGLGKRTYFHLQTAACKAAAARIGSPTFGLRNEPILAAGPAPPREGQIDKTNPFGTIEPLEAAKRSQLRKTFGYTP